MKAKNLHSPDQRVQALCGHGFGVVAAQRRFNDAQIGQEIFGAGIGVLRGHGVTGGITAGQCFQSGG
jgi:hypothetical protein